MKKKEQVRKVKLKSLTFVLIVILLCLCGVVFINPLVGYRLSSFEGKVIDADTKEPISGAVVLAVYYKTVYTVAGSNSYITDGQETLTDESGEFRIPEVKVRSMSKRGSPRGKLIIFKPGYGVFPDHKQSNAVDVNKSWPPPNEFIVCELPELKTEKDRKANIHIRSYHEIPYQKSMFYMKMLNEERTNLSYSPLPAPKEGR